MINIIVTCEHGGTSVPPKYRELFRGRHRLLNSHRGHDRHARECAQLLARKLGARLFTSTVTRLLVDVNRSPHHRGLFSDLSGRLSGGDKEHILNSFYLPYRRHIEAEIRTAVSTGTLILHVSVHSFAPVVKGITKKADIGILYDPSRDLEKVLSVQWQKLLRMRRAAWNVRRNYPYHGRSDGLVTYFRKMFPPDRYAGIELEFNQRLLNRHRTRLRMLCDLTAASLKDAVHTMSEKIKPAVKRHDGR